MFKVAIIENQKVINIIVADQQFIDDTELHCIVLEDSSTVNIGDSYINGVFSKIQTKPSVPKLVSRRQAVQQLIIEGLDDDVEAVLASIPDVTTRKLMTVWYRDSQVFERDRPEILQVWTALGRTSEQLDATFIAAAKL